MHVHGRYGAIMEFRVLGPVELWSEGQRYNPGSTKARCVLAILLLNLSTVVPVDVLISRLWDTNPPPKARESLSAYVTRLRRVLGQVAGDRVQLASRAHGYVLEGDPEDVDLHRFRRLRRQASALADSGDRDHAALLLREADALWHGQALEGIYGDSLERVRHGLEEERRAATLERIELELALGHHASLVVELQQLSDSFPLDEAFIAHHVNALYLSGRVSDALGVYWETRMRLISELGTEPGPALAELHQRILRRDSGPGAELSFRGPGQIPAPDRLPPGAADFIGRVEEMQALTSGPDDVAVIAVTGMPGAGKTALVIEAARRMQERFPDGQLFVSFHTHDPRNPPLDSAGAMHRLLRILGVPAGHIPQALAQRAALWHAELARRRMVVVLDDVAGPDQVRPLLPAAGQCRILITARRRIRGLGEVKMLTLGMLPADDGIELFTRIAGSPLASDLDRVAEVVRLCGRLPLAIQLAARGLRQGGTGALTDLIDELSDLAAGLGGVVSNPDLTAAFELSYRTLSDSSQRLFRRLGLHPGVDITVHAAAALDGGSPAEVETTLAVLVDHHLLERTDRCFHLHDLMRQFAESCAMRDDPGSVRRLASGRLLDYYLGTADRADRLLYPHARRDPAPASQRPTVAPAMDTPARAVDWMDLEWRNILHAARQAGEHERKRQCARLTFTLARFLEAGGHWSEAVSAHAVALQACRDLDDLAGVARASLDLSVVLGRTGHQQEALRHAREAAAICGSLADQRGEAEALDQAGTLHRNSGRFREGLAHHQAASDLYRSIADWHGMASTLNHTAIAYYHLGRYPGAVDHLQSALEIYRQIGDRSGEAKTLNNLGRVQRHQGYHRDALQTCQKALEIYMAIGGEQNQAILHHNIGCIYHYKKDYDEALTAYRRALAIYRRIGDLPGVAAALNDTGVTYHALGHFSEALIHHQRAKLMAEQLGDSFERVIAFRGIADAHQGQGHHDEAANHYQTALILAREIGEPYQEGKILDGIAETVLQTQGYEAARIYWHQALDAFEQLGVPEAGAVRIRLGSLPPQRDGRSS
jgi:DNA-binding SARP family transcriptional activator/tetratricopeptide (TPR) repeat protein